jgi:acetolactate synthase-1/2/3 large subunit
MMRANGGTLVYETLKSYGVNCLFGMEDPIHVFHAVDPAATKIITVRDEKHAAIMAHGYAQVSGRPGVCAATFGPGASNLSTGLLEALRSSVPVIALVQDHPIQLRNKNASSQLNYEVALAPYAKEILRIDTAEMAGSIIRRAFRLATSGRPGPVVVLCPTDAMAAEAECEVRAEADCADFPAFRVRARADGIAQAAKLLSAAECPLVVAGGGAMISGAFVELKALAERFSVPVATTLTGRGSFADDHPMAVGPIGSSVGGKYGRGQVGNALLAEADLVFLMGTRTGQLCYSDWSLPKPGTRIIHLDVDPQEIGRNFDTALGLVGDVRDSLRELLAYSESQGLKRSQPDNGARLHGLIDDWQAELRPMAAATQIPMRPEAVIDAVENVIHPNSLLTADASYVTNWVISNIRVPAAGRFVLSPRGTGGIGWALPAAMGAKLAAPDRDVTCISGDGAFGYVMNELETAARYQIDLLVIVFNNSTLAFQRHWEEVAKGSYRECNFLDVDYSEVARALRCGGERVHDVADLPAAIARGQAFAGPYLIDAVVDPEAAGPVIGMERPLAQDAAH